MMTYRKRHKELSELLSKQLMHIEDSRVRDVLVTNVLDYTARIVREIPTKMETLMQPKLMELEMDAQFAVENMLQGFPLEQQLIVDLGLNNH